MMKRVGLLLGGLFVVGLFVQSVMARPDYKKAADARYKDSPIAEQAAEAKCNLCHYGKSKKNRNDFGEALMEWLTEDMYKENKSDKEGLLKAAGKALEAAEKKESAGGETFAERIKAGKLPGTNPEE